jgi:UDP-4-keto-D-QuiNAc 4-reductase
MKHILVTGANGFVGAALCQHLVESGLKVRAAVRNLESDALRKQANAGWETCAIGDIAHFQGWKPLMTGVDVVIHTAARVHVMRDSAPDPLAEFRRVNKAATKHLARCAAENGVRRMVYVSSVKVNGEATKPGQSFSETDAPCPVDPYGLSKLEAELELKSIAAESGLDVVIVRPPLVYGPRVGGNMATMLSCIYRGIPLPLAGVRNERTLVALDNLCSFLRLCATHSGAAGETFLIGDEQALSTPQMLRLLAAGLGERARLYSLPPSLLKAALSVCGASAFYHRLSQSLVVDARKATRLLGWRAPVSTDQALGAAMRWYAETRRKTTDAHA